jgi:FtsP/CotA-like multicopper oxidase with cupredoxin domain
VRILACNGSIPGATLKVLQGATVQVHVTNRGDLDATVHWHGLACAATFARDPARYVVAERR